MHLIRLCQLGARCAGTGAPRQRAAGLSAIDVLHPIGIVTLRGVMPADAELTLKALQINGFQVFRSREKTRNLCFAINDDVCVRLLCKKKA